MATIRRQKVGKYTYWQIVESKRINGKPRPIVLMHLGTAEALLKKLKAGIKKKIRSASHGAVAALWNISKEIELLNIFNKYFTQQIRDGLSVGKSLLLAAIHRAIKPASKRAFADWAKQTTLPEIVKFTPKDLTSQHFWDQMNTVTEEEIESAEEEVTLQLIKKYNISLDTLFFDTTNFFTFIDSQNENCKIPQRGHNKQKRNDLRQFGLALLLSRDFFLPIGSQVYEGNIPDSKLFPIYLTKIRKRLENLNVHLEDITLVFDKGNNSEKAFNELDENKMHFVASLTPVYHKDLLEIPSSNFHTVEVNDKTIRCYRTSKNLWGEKRTIIIYLSEKLKEGQIRGVERSVLKKIEKLKELRNKLKKSSARKRKKEQLAEQIKKIISGEWGEFVINVQIIKKKDGSCDINFNLNNENYLYLTEKLFGKRILVTNQSNWTDGEIIEAYHGQSRIERIFRHLKNPHYHSVRPQNHWTDQKIEVHAFICLTGFLLSQILWKKSKEAGFNLSIESLLDKLGRVRRAETISLSGLKGKPQKEVQLEVMDKDLHQLYEKLVEKAN